ncbi:hypothetical protein [Lacinutrix salivirga]
MNYDYQKHEIITNYDLKQDYPNLHFYLNLYYPVGIKSSDDKYKSYIGQKNLSRNIKDKIENNEHLKLYWTNGFLKKISQEINYQTLDATYGLVPNYGGRIILNQSDNLRFSTELQFFVSLINNFYSIQIIYSDKYTSYEHDFSINTTGYGINTIIVSPIKKKYGELFLKIENLIKEEFLDASFIPFRFNLTKLKDFEVPYEFSKDFQTSISKAFFHKGKLLHENTEIIGDIDYKIDKL